MVQLLRIVVMFSAAVGQLLAQDIISVTTTIGVVNGKVETVTSFEKTGKLYKFLGIPFAEPPVGDLRFKKPVPKTHSTTPIDAFAHNNACMQEGKRPNVTYSEDCLYLNIYAPERENENIKLPVMIWIHGGAFLIGDSNLYISDYLSIHGSVIVVTLNYRLSIFGFLSTGDSASLGNYGLWDQQLAIKWVHENIAAFGGNTKNVTIFGESAGSSSVIYQGLHTGNKDLFQRIIGESGSIMGWWASTDKGLHDAQTMGSYANCTTEPTHVLVSCLRNITADKLIQMISYAPNGDNFQYYPFRPTVDNDFIKFDPNKVFDLTSARSRDALQFFANFDLLTGVNIAEGSLGLIPMFGVSDPFSFETNRSDFEKRLVPLLIKGPYGKDASSVINKVIIAEYTNWTDPDNSENVRSEYIRMHGDFQFNADMYRTLNAHFDQATTANTYMYLLDIEPETSFGFDIPYITKAVHGEELLLVFGYRFSFFGTLPNPKEWEKKLSAKVMTLWTNFAKSGNPNFPDDLGINWTRYTADDQHYLHITRNLTSKNVRQRWNIGAVNLWLDTIPAIAQLKICETMIDGDGGVSSAASTLPHLLLLFLGITSGTVIATFLSL